MLEKSKDLIVRELEEKIGLKDIKNSKIKPDYLKDKLLNISENFEFIEA